MYRICRYHSGLFTASGERTDNAKARWLSLTDVLSQLWRAFSICLGSQERLFFHPLKGHSPEASYLISTELLVKRICMLSILIMGLLHSSKKYIIHLKGLSLISFKDSWCMRKTGNFIDCLYDPLFSVSFSALYYFFPHLFFKIFL